MAVILCLSSLVARGAIGATAARIALEGLGHECWVLPTVVLSNHPGHSTAAGMRVPAPELKRMLDALEGNGWLNEVDAVLTGYLPSEAHAGVAFDAIGRVREASPDVRVLCDPTFGDVPKGVYVEEAAARAIVDWLLPVANMARLNAFELAWATGRSVTTLDEAKAAARALGPKRVVVTSAPAEEGTLANLLFENHDLACANVPMRPQAPHGTGDLLDGLLLGHLLNGAEPAQALALAVAGIEAALDASGEADELKLAADRNAWLKPTPWPLQKL